MPVATSSPPSPSETILVVDDEPDILRLVQLVLEQTQDWRVLCAPSASEAVEIARREPLVAVLLDARMPEEDGFVTLRRLRSEAGITATPVILMTALAQPSDTTGPPGFAGVIPKPFDPLTLPDQIKRILASHEPR